MAVAVIVIGSLIALSVVVTGIFALVESRKIDKLDKHKWSNKDEKEFETRNKEIGEGLEKRHKEAKSESKPMADFENSRKYFSKRKEVKVEKSLQEDEENTMTM